MDYLAPSCQIKPEVSGRPATQTSKTMTVKCNGYIYR